MPHEPAKMTRYSQCWDGTLTRSDSGSWIHISDAQSLAAENERLREAMRVAVEEVHARRGIGGMNTDRLIDTRAATDANPTLSAMLREVGNA